VTALMPTTAAATLADVHREPAMDGPRHRQLVLILVLGPLVLDLAATLTPRCEWRVELLIHLARRLTVPVLAVFLLRPAPRPARNGFGSPRENGAAWRFPARRASSSFPSSLPTLARSRSFSPASRAISPINRSFSANTDDENANSHRSPSSDSPAGSTSTLDAATATTATQVRGRLHNPCPAR
jgi:hypothetical protein